jgi:hypothetical protein
MPFLPNEGPFGKFSLRCFSVVSWIMCNKVWKL